MDAPTPVPAPTETGTDQIATAKLGTEPEVALDIGVQMLSYEGEMVWSRFNAYLAANGFLATALGFASSGTEFRILSIYLAAVGMALCFLWQLITGRGFSQCSHYFQSLVRIEGRCKDGNEVFLKEAKEFGDNLAQPYRPELKLELKRPLKSLKCLWYYYNPIALYKYRMTPRIADATIAMFFLIYVGVLVNEVSKLIPTARHDSPASVAR